MTMNEENQCETCGRTRAWHLTALGIIHEFNDGSVPFRQTFGERTGDGVGGSARPPATVELDAPQSVPGMFDPVLRMALIDAGVVTPDQLRAAEDKIRATTFTLGGNSGNSSQQVPSGPDAGGDPPVG